jgi:hypothetical protein
MGRHIFSRTLTATCSLFYLKTGQKTCSDALPGRAQWRFASQAGAAVEFDAAGFLIAPGSSFGNMGRIRDQLRSGLWTTIERLGQLIGQCLRYPLSDVAETLLF